MQNDDDIREFLKDGARQPPDRLLSKAMKRSAAGVGQRDTLLFAVVRIWQVIAELMAPVFAALAERKARVASAKQGQTRKYSPDTDSNQE